MATAPTDIPVEGADVGADPGLSPEQASEIARMVVKRHRTGKEGRRELDLTREKYAIHLNGENQSQWMDVINGQRVDYVPNIDGGPRAQTNLLRPITDDWVSFLTAIPYAVLAEPGSGPNARDMARIDTIWANSLLVTQKANELFAEAAYTAAPYGHCPIHVQWRQDGTADLVEPLANPAAPQVQPGYIDIWVGDPWATVYDNNATRRSVRRMSYERVFPLETVQAAFADVGGIETLKGRKDLPSSSRFQRMARKWAGQAVYQHGTAAMFGGSDYDETVALLFEEVAPGVEPEWPRGKLTIVALNGVAEPDDAWGSPFFLHQGPLPGGRLSAARLYSTDAFGTVEGYPMLAPLDELQVRANQLETLLLEGGRRAAKPQTATTAGALPDDYAYEEDGILEAASTVLPQYMQYPTDWMNAIEKRLEATKQEMFRIGGWQAASRGESNSGDPAAKYVAQQRADDSTKGPSSRGLQGTIVEILQIAHALTKEYAGPVPIPVKVAGQDYGHLVGPYIYASQMSDDPPNFRVVSGFATTPEARAQQLINLAMAVGADQEPILRTKQLRKQYPDSSIWPNEVDLEEIQDRRISAINALIRTLCQQAAQQSQQMPPMWQQQALNPQAINAQVDQRFPLQRIDPLDKHIEGLAEIAQDPNEDPLAVQVATLRIDMLLQWQAQIAAQAMAQQQAMQPQRPGATSDAGRGQAQAGAPPSEPQTLESEVSSLTQQAMGAA